MKKTSLLLASAFLTVSLFTTKIASAEQPEAVTHVMLEVHHKKDGTLEVKKPRGHAAVHHFKTRQDSGTEEAATLFFSELFDKAKDAAKKVGDTIKKGGKKALDTAKQVAGDLYEGGKQLASQVVTPDNISKLVDGGIKVGMDLLSKKTGTTGASTSTAED